MSEIRYTICDSCGAHHPECPEESWNRMTEGWIAIERYESVEREIVRYDFCKECAKKMMAAVE